MSGALKRDEWETVRLGDVCDVRDGTHDSPKYILEGGYPLVTSKNIQNDSINLTDVNFISETDYLAINKRSRVDDGDILMPMIGTIGNPIIVKKTFAFAIKNLALIKFEDATLLNRYVLYLLSSEYFSNYILSENRGGTQKFLSLNAIRNFTFPLPPLDIQRRIADTLDKVTELITLRKTQLEKLDELVKARFVELFEGKYATIKIGDIFSTTSGGTPSKSHPEYYENGTVPWLSSGEVNIGVIHSVKNYITQEGVDNSSAKMVPENSVVIAMYGATAGQVGLLRIATTTNQAVCSVLPDSRYVPEYLYYAIRSKKDWMISQCAGGAQPNISQGVIKRMEIIDAPYEFQKQFASFVEQTDKSKVIIQQSLDTLETLKKSLMQEYFG